MTHPKPGLPRPHLDHICLRIHAHPQRRHNAKLPPRHHDQTSSRPRVCLRSIKIGRKWSVPRIAPTSLKATSSDQFSRVCRSMSSSNSRISWRNGLKKCYDNASGCTKKWRRSSCHTLWWIDTKRLSIKRRSSLLLSYLHSKISM